MWKNQCMMDECVWTSKTLCWRQASTPGRGNSRCEDPRVTMCLKSLKNGKMISWLEWWSVESGGLWVWRPRSSRSLKAMLMRTVLPEQELIHGKRDKERERTNFRRWGGMEILSTNGDVAFHFAKWESDGFMFKQICRFCGRKFISHDIDFLKYKQSHQLSENAGTGYESLEKRL